ncbi:NTP pyrophosphohydrolase [Serratia sp. UGAL515B_01]|nr:NTP pyrophosphohydrolase [Serratia sp. UGAL515B_01]WON78977.1 NTP pyrophosphohydrolase [Serratia sp. UGAL515B_01]
MRPVEAGLIPYTALRDRSISLADVALMNEFLDLQFDNAERIEKWRQRS